MAQRERSDLDPDLQEVAHALQVLATLKGGTWIVVVDATGQLRLDQVTPAPRSAS
jgi:hypothetical protein